VIDDGEQDVSIVLGDGLVAHLLLVVVPAVADKGAHVQHLGKVHSGRDLLVKSGRVLEPFQVKAGDNWKFLHGELLGGLLVGVAPGAPDLGSRA